MKCHNNNYIVIGVYCCVRVILYMKLHLTVCYWILQDIHCGSLTHTLHPRTHPFFAVAFAGSLGGWDVDCRTSPSRVDATFSVSFSCFSSTSLLSLLRECSIFTRLARDISPSTACSTCIQLLHLQSSRATIDKVKEKLFAVHQKFCGVPHKKL